MARAVLLSLLAGAMAGTLLSSFPAGHYGWYLSRAAGLMSFAALSGSVILGLLLSSRSGPRWLPKAALFELHQFLAVLGLALAGVHAGALLFDSTVRFGAIDVLVPFAAPYRPAWTGLGVAAAWLSAAVAASFWVKKRIGQKAWRRFHFVSFAVYLMALGHGIGAGSDTGAPVVYWGYVLSAGMVVGLTVFRVLAVRLQRRPARQQRPRRGATAAARPAP
jgi:sulfoxide reductase heme-binding subunit YedZ